MCNEKDPSEEEDVCPVTLLGGPGLASVWGAEHRTQALSEGRSGVLDGSGGLPTPAPVTGDGFRGMLLQPAEAVEAASEADATATASGFQECSRLVWVWHEGRGGVEHHLGNASRDGVLPPSLALLSQQTGLL